MATCAPENVCADLPQAAAEFVDFHIRNSSIFPAIISALSLGQYISRTLSRASAGRVSANLTIATSGAVPLRTVRPRYLRRQ